MDYLQADYMLAIQDIVALLIQGSGGGIAASANNLSSQKLVHTAPSRAPQSTDINHAYLGWQHHASRYHLPDEYVSCRHPNCRTLTLWLTVAMVVFVLLAAGYFYRYANDRPARPDTNYYSPSQSTAKALLNKNLKLMTIGVYFSMFFLLIRYA